MRASPQSAPVPCPASPPPDAPDRLATSPARSNQVQDKFYFTVSVASSAAMAMDILQRAKFDVVLLDALMPEVNGFEARMPMRPSPRRPVSPPCVAALHRRPASPPCIAAAPTFGGLPLLHRPR